MPVSYIQPDFLAFRRKSRTDRRRELYAKCSVFVYNTGQRIRPLAVSVVRKGQNPAIKPESNSGCVDPLADLVLAQVFPGSVCVRDGALVKGELPLRWSGPDG